MVDHPQGYGLGNAGATAARNDVALKAGESTYTEAGAETGLAGALLWTAWVIALLLALVGAVRGELRVPVAVVASGFAAVLLLALQTDVVGDPWLAYVAWATAGLALPRGGTVQA
jgi:O-antigen ligase